MEILRKIIQLTGVGLAGALMQSALASTVEMTAVFRPDPAKPMQNTFINTTPQGGYCGDHPEYCEAGVFSILLPVRFRVAADIRRCMSSVGARCSGFLHPGETSRWCTT